MANRAEKLDLRSILCDDGATGLTDVVAYIPLEG